MSGFYITLNPSTTEKPNDCKLDSTTTPKWSEAKEEELDENDCKHEVKCGDTQQYIQYLTGTDCTGVSGTP